MQTYDIKSPSPHLIAFREAAACFARSAEVSCNMRPGHVGEREAEALSRVLHSEMWRCHESVVEQPPVTIEILAEHSEATAAIAELIGRDMPSVQRELLRLQMALHAFLKVTLNGVAVERAA